MAKRLTQVIWGLFLYALGIVLTINANLGLAPWDIFHQGAAIHLNLTIGQTNILASCIIVVIDFYLKEKIGIATVLNVFLIGSFVDILMLNHLVPIFHFLPLQFLMLIIGLVTIGYASYVYIAPALGAGPRDGLMVALCKHTGKSVRVVRAGIDIIVSAIGWLLGGSLGVGTVMMALFLGPTMQWIFRKLHFDIPKIEHVYIDEEIRRFFQGKSREKNGRVEDDREQDDREIEKHG